MNLLLLIIGIGMLLGFGAGFAVFAFHLTKTVLFDLLELFQLLNEAIWKFAKTYYEQVIKTREYRHWKRFRLPILIRKSRHGDMQAAGERIARSNHKYAPDGGKKYDY